MSTNFDEFSVQTNTLSNAQTDQKLNEDGPATDQSSVKDEGLPQKQSFPSHSDTIPHEPSQKSVRTLVEDKSVSSVASKQNSVTSSTASHGSGGSKKSRQSISWRPGSISQPSRSTTSNESKLSVRETKILLYKMNNTELVNNVQELQKNVKHLELENMVFLHFLQQNDPTAVEAFESTMKNVQSMQDRASVSSRRLTLTKHGSRRESVFLGTSYSVIIPTPSEKEGAKINVNQKIELVLREIDDIQNNLDKVTKKCNTIRHKLKAELEEMSVREAEISETMNMFQDVFINGTVQKYTQKNPIDRFARFMNECLKHNRAIIDKLRLRTSSLKVQYQKICNKLVQKKLLGENLQQVDFDQLQISNKHLEIKIDKRNLLLLELKKMNGKAHLLLSRTKKLLGSKIEDLQVIKETIKLREEMITKLDDQCEKVAEELEDTKHEYDRIKTKSENFEVPSVLEYVKTIAELGVLKKNVKIWARRKEIEDMALNAKLRLMKKSLSATKSKFSEDEEL